MIRELTNSAWSVLAAYEADEQAGLLSREEAQAAAADVVSRAALRRGRPRLLLDPGHGADDGHAPVSAAISTGRTSAASPTRAACPSSSSSPTSWTREEEGYVDYVWQWFDDPERLEPKESYVKGFEPWDWVIGTGLYTDDVRAEIDRIERDLIVAGPGDHRRHRRAAAVRAAAEPAHRAAPRGGRGASARLQRALPRAGRGHHRGHAADHRRPAALRQPDLPGAAWLQRSRQLEFLELADVLPRASDNDAAVGRRWSSGAAESPVLGVGREGVLTRSDGSALECLLTLDPVVFGGQRGPHPAGARHQPSLPRRAECRLPWAASGRLFRALAARRAVFIELSAGWARAAGRARHRRRGAAGPRRLLRRGRRLRACLPAPA